MIGINIGTHESMIDESTQIIIKYLKKILS